MVRSRSAKRYYKPIRGYDRSRCTRFAGRCDLTGCNRREGAEGEVRETEICSAGSRMLAGGKGVGK